MTNLKTKKPQIWQSSEFTISRGSQISTEADVIHEFIKTLKFESYRIEKIQVYEAPARALISLNRHSTARSKSKSARYDAKINLDVRPCQSGNNIVLQYTMLSEKPARNSPGIMASLFGKRKIDTQIANSA